MIEMNTPSTKEVVMVRLITGEVIMGFLAQGQATTMLLENPVLLSMQLGQDGKLNVNMMDYIPFSADEAFEFAYGHVLNVMKPNEGLEASFRTKQSKIITPPKPSFKL